MEYNGFRITPVNDVKEYVLQAERELKPSWRYVGASGRIYEGMNLSEIKKAAQRENDTVKTYKRIPRGVIIRVGVDFLANQSMMNDVETELKKMIDFYDLKHERFSNKYWKTRKKPTPFKTEVFFGEIRP